MSNSAEGNGCYICQPENPNADPEGCAACEREWWAWYFARVTVPSSPTERGQ